MSRASHSSRGIVTPDGPLDLVVHTRNRFDFIDLTEHLAERIGQNVLFEGACVAFVRHTTCGLIVNEWETGALADLRRRLEELFPTDAYYEHDDLSRRTENLVPGERPNGHAHVAQMLMGATSLTIPVRSGRLLLGRWQRVILIELDRPRDRMVAVQLLGPSRDGVAAEDGRDRPQSVPKLIA